jgi:hypothetical protein
MGGVRRQAPAAAGRSIQAVDCEPSPATVVVGLETPTTTHLLQHPQVSIRGMESNNHYACLAQRDQPSLSNLRSHSKAFGGSLTFSTRLPLFPVDVLRTRG